MFGFRFGCCKDNETTAEGPKFEGCPLPACMKTKFGCCLDGETRARNKKLKGCPKVKDCKTSLYGCCDDEKSPGIYIYT